MKRSCVFQSSRLHVYRTRHATNLDMWSYSFSQHFHSHYFRNLVCLHVLQDRLQAKSTSMMAFHQEREDDEDMTSIHMTMLEEPYGGQGDQRGCPNREGGPKLIRFESPRWRPKSSLSPARAPGPVCLKLVTHDAFGLCFR